MGINIRYKTQKTQKTIKSESPSFFYLSVVLITKLIPIYYNQSKLCEELSLHFPDVLEH